MPANGGLSTAQAKQVVIDLITKGQTTTVALKAAQRSQSTYENWRSADPDFKAKVDAARVTKIKASARKQNVEDYKLGFAEWRKKFLDRETYPHMQMWIDLLEGREITPHPSMAYEVGRPSRLLVNTPPFHAKSTTLTVEYVTYRICMNPSIRVIIVSKTLEQAKKFLRSVKRYLTESPYATLQAAYAPTADGFRAPGETWTANKFYVAGRDDNEKDPTVEALGMGGQIYGARADLIILDDCATLGNAGEWGKQLDWINQEVASRLDNGKLLIVGTRVAPVDMYSELRNGDNYISGKSPWTYLAQPAVLSYGEEPKDWVTLWPRSNNPLDNEAAEDPDEDGTYPAWDGTKLSHRRNELPARTWALVYMQQGVTEDAVFNPACVMGSQEGRRKPGPLIPGAWGHPRAGMEGQYVIASMDPAMSGDTFTTVYAVDRKDNKRRVLQCYVKTNPDTAYIQNIIKQVTDEYGVDEWVIEQNAFQLYLIHDPVVTEYLRQRGIKLTPHYSGRNKQDPDFGVASVAPLFGSIKVHKDGHRAGLDHNGDNLIELPRIADSEGIKALVEQLITWQPGKLGKQLKMDGPMSLWFAELRAREVLGVGRRREQHFVHNPYLSRGDQRERAVISISDYRQNTAQAG